MIVTDKISAAKRQLKTAVKLFFNNDDDLSIHTLSGAALQILHDIAEKMGLPSKLFLNSTMIRPEKMKEWNSDVVKHRNFLKHADRDAGDDMEFNPVINDFEILNAVMYYSQIVDSPEIDFEVYKMWFFLKHDNLLLQGGPLKEYIDSHRINLPNHEDKELFWDYIKMNRNFKIKIPIAGM